MQVYINFFFKIYIKLYQESGNKGGGSTSITINNKKVNINKNNKKYVINYSSIFIIYLLIYICRVYFK